MLVKVGCEPLTVTHLLQRPASAPAPGLTTSTSYVTGAAVSMLAVPCRTVDVLVPVLIVTGIGSWPGTAGSGVRVTVGPPPEMTKPLPWIVKAWLVPLLLATGDSSTLIAPRPWTK